MNRIKNLFDIEGFDSRVNDPNHWGVARRFISPEIGIENIVADKVTYNATRSTLYYYFRSRSEKWNLDQNELGILFEDGTLKKFKRSDYDDNWVEYCRAICKFIDELKKNNYSLPPEAVVLSEDENDSFVV